MNLMWPEQVVLLDVYNVSDETLVSSMWQARVEFASGETDTDSICDQEDGDGQKRFWHRNPYAYRRDQKLNGSKCYRRRMMTSIGLDVVEPVGTPAAQLGFCKWVPEVDTDDDGFVTQSPFTSPLASKSMPRDFRSRRKTRLIGRRMKSFRKSGKKCSATQVRPIQLFVTPWVRRTSTT
jgi:hypothetical protein